MRHFLVKSLPFSLFGLSALFLPLIASAHEVYVLPSDVVAKDLTMPSLGVFEIISTHAGQFFFWFFISIWAILTVLSISLSKPLEKYLHPYFESLKRYAPLAGRLTLGSAIIASGYYGALFGPELPMSDFLPTIAIHPFKTFLIVAGTLITVGLFTRIVASLLVLIYLAMWVHYGTYMLTYTNYFGEMLLTIIVGNASHALDRYFHHMYPYVFHEFLLWIERHAFLILRVTFGISLIFASLYAKFLHAQLAIDTVITYNLTNYFPFDPEFIVLGAFAIELLLGLFFLLGIEVRFASLFLLFWLTLSLLYFGEVVWPHLILAGVAIAIFLHGYDRNTIEFRLLRKLNRRAREPVL